jgi:hypothetical protein
MRMLEKRVERTEKSKPTLSHDCSRPLQGYEHPWTVAALMHGHVPRRRPAVEPEFLHTLHLPKNR